MRIDLEFTTSQQRVWEALYDNEHEIVFTEGGVYTGKTYLGCVWIINNALTNNDTRWLVCNEKLKRVTLETVSTLIQILGEWGIPYKQNKIDRTITFNNGSMVLYRELGYKSNDPNYERLGCSEYTGVFIDSLEGIREEAVSTIFKRIKWKVDGLIIKRKLLMVSAKEDMPEWAKNRYLNEIKEVSIIMDSSLRFWPAYTKA